MINFRICLHWLNKDIPTDVTCIRNILSKKYAQYVSNACTFIFRSLRLCVGILLWFDVCWRYGVVRLGCCGILMQAEALVPQPA